jgi:tetratricopeptide (TPR) repeat protein
MSTTLRIEELRKKFDENPRRYFAPLANEYRKAGDLQQAISICQAHLPQQPGHMSGHIVYGQALFEARQFDQARTVFETALALDPENLIALRYLGDIAFELGDRGSARGWYTRVLETDPRNEEIAALMAAMGEERSTRDSGPSAAPAAAPEPSAAAQPTRETAAGAEAAAAPASAAAGEPTGATAAEAPAGTPPSAGNADAELEKLFSRPPQSAPPGPTADSSAPPAAAPSAFSPVAGFGGGAAADAPPSLEQSAPSINVPTFDAQRGDDAPLQNPPSLDRGGDGASATGGFVTETMAELYLKQGFHDRALAVYEQLVAQNPHDRALRERMERVAREAKSSASAWNAGLTPATRAATQGPSGGRGAATVRQFLAQIGSRRPGGRGPGVSPPPGSGPRNSGEFRAPQEQALRGTSSGSIDALFGGKAPSRDDAAAASTLADAFGGGSGGGAADAQMGGRPAHQATTELSLDHVFRDGGNVGGRGQSPVSYDQFFAQPAPSAAPSTESTSASAPPTTGSDDIEQFNAWLQGLKKR